MAASNALKTAFISSLLAISALPGISNADQRELDAEGFYKEPVCGHHALIKQSLSIMVGEEPTGIKASNAKWDMEIYLNKKDGSWTLLGKSKDGSVPSYKVCSLASSLDSPFDQQKWYTTYFSKPDTDPINNQEQTMVPPK